MVYILHAFGYLKFGYFNSCWTLYSCLERLWLDYFKGFNFAQILSTCPFQNV